MIEPLLYLLVLTVGPWILLELNKVGTYNSNDIPSKDLRTK